MVRRSGFFVLAAARLIINAPVASAQTAPPDPSSCTESLRLPQADLAGVYADYTRVAELSGTVPLRPRVNRRPSEEREVVACAGRPPLPWSAWLRARNIESRIAGVRITPLPARWVARVNTAYPTTRNDGAMWAGRGVSTSLEGGVTATWARGPVRISAALAPRLLFHENRDFETVAEPQSTRFSPYVYPWHFGRIDWPLRFGGSAFWELDPGQSHLRLDAYGWTVGVSTENQWWGPAVRYPLLMSSTAPGFPHLFLGTAAPRDIRIGRVEGRLIWGRLAESDHFDADATNDHRLFAGIVLDFEPRWLPGLFLGLARAYMVQLPPEGLPASDYVMGPYTDVRANPQSGEPLADNQLLSVFARWALPADGFEVYVEWAREDHWEDLDDLLMQPDHSQAYVLGFQKVVPSGDRWVRLYGELAYLQAATSYRSGRPLAAFYTHTPLVHGYTHRGQLLGAPIGPGSDAQILGADLFADWGRLGIYFERIRHDNDAYYNHWARYYGSRGHDLELTTGVRHDFFDGDFQIGWGIGYSARKNRNFVGLDGFNWDLRTETNWSLDLEVTWSPKHAQESRRPEITSRPDTR